MNLAADSAAIGSTSYPQHERTLIIALQNVKLSAFPQNMPGQPIVGTQIWIGAPRPSVPGIS